MKIRIFATSSIAAALASGLSACGSDSSGTTSGSTATSSDSSSGGSTATVASKLILGGAVEFKTRANGLPGLQKNYGVVFAKYTVTKSKRHRKPDVSQWGHINVITAVKWSQAKSPTGRVAQARCRAGAPSETRRASSPASGSSKPEGSQVLQESLFTAGGGEECAVYFPSCNAASGRYGVLPFLW